MIKSKRDLVSLGAEIPTSWLLLVPFASLYWSFKWVAGYCKLTDNDNAVIMFIGAVLFPPFALLLPYMIQSAINEHAPSPVEPTASIAA
jgi:glycopeptide antibiotics resistance protein